MTKQLGPTQIGQPVERLMRQIGTIGSVDGMRMRSYDAGSGAITTVVSSNRGTEAVVHASMGDITPSQNRYNANVFIAKD